MPDIQFIEEGKYKIQTVGPVSTGVAKGSGKPWRTVDVQFEGDGTWYSLFWPLDKKDLPQVGAELDGKKEFNKDFNKHQFNTGFGGNKANWNPAGANAQIYIAAATIVHDFLTLRPAHLEDWEKGRKEKQSGIEQYLETISALAGTIKQKVVGMGSGDATAQVASKTSAPPPQNGDPGPVPPVNDNWAGSDEEEVNLGGM